MANETRATRAIIHLGAIRENLAAIRSKITSNILICAAVKANAYGHGAVPVGRVLRSEGVEYLGVATPGEGLELRESGDTGRILLLGPTVPEEIPQIRAAGLEIMVTDSNYLHALERHLPPGEALPVHLKIDTGMGRVGCRAEEALPLARRIDRSGRFKLAGVATHFPSADSDSPDDRCFTQNQAALLQHCVQSIRQDGIDPGIVHAANSAASLIPGMEFDMVRPGISLYGYGEGEDERRRWKPVMELQSRITALKKIPAGSPVSYGRSWLAPEDGWLATIPAGYADGYTRLLSGKVSVLIGGKSYPVAGRICMDQCMVYLGSETDVRLYDPVTLFGPDPRGLNAGDLARMIGSISYEILTGVSLRVPRIYRD